MNKSNYNINTGKLLEKVIAEKKITKTDLGVAINRNALAVLKYTRNESVQTGILIELCYALEHNFFKDIANQLPDGFTTTNVTDQHLISEKDQLIVQLLEENKVLKIKNETLLTVLGNK